MATFEKYLTEAKEYSSKEVGFVEELKPLPKVCGTCGHAGHDYDEIIYCTIIKAEEGETGYYDSRYKGDRLSVSPFSACKKYKKGY